ncbi:hypothetical protein DNH61_17450 [Paenibacillus sambharensis]|uniref:Response regulatory domain-containing protein n=1 Tax=Paenibacillus sambharensis TaxID=1803190 RepID=A0A2W1LJL6_9BACL|nr:response regulator [Paenibacillus sambharensis]PZD94734.1 hypothetical protein DNH61_17450 [Paenibacillus sambharensis]
MLENKLRVLIAEDNLVNVELLQMVLMRWGYESCAAYNGEEVLAALKGGRYDLIFMDIRMPGLDGIGATQAIMERYPPGERPVIVAMTGYVMQSERDRCIAAGMDDFIGKPFEFDEVRRVLQDCENNRLSS